ncbi:MAG: hypothetical protein R3B09_01880 [Nannocystaceae bacterium]
MGTATTLVLGSVLLGPAATPAPAPASTTSTSTAPSPPATSSSAGPSRSPAVPSPRALSPAGTSPDTTSAATGQGPARPPAPTIPPASPAAPRSGVGVTPPPTGLPPAPVYLWERSYFDLFVLRREDLLRWQPVQHFPKGLTVELRPTTTTTLEFTRGPLRHLSLTSVVVHGAVDSPWTMSTRIGLKIPGTNTSVFGMGSVASSLAGALVRGRWLGLAGRF